MKLKKVENLIIAFAVALVLMLVGLAVFTIVR